MFKRFLIAISLLFSFMAVNPAHTLAAAGISPSGGKTVQEGVTFTINVVASGATFDSLQGTISVSGPVSIVSFSAGSATWLPGKAPANNNQFVGIVSPKSSLTVATISLRGTKVGSGSVKVTGARLASNGTEVGSSGGTTSFTITRAPTLPGQIAVASSTHPDQNESYEATTVALSWTAPANGASGYSTVIDQVADTAPAQTVNTKEIAATYEGLAVGTHYFHVRALNSDGWGSTTHFVINIKPSTDSSLVSPAITSIKTTDDYKNDLSTGTLTGIIFEGTGPVDYGVLLVFAPDLALPADKYTAPIVDGEGNWKYIITDPIKSGFYKVTTQARKEGVVSNVSAATMFEISLKDGGTVNVLGVSDSTEQFKNNLAAEEARIAAEKSLNKTIGIYGFIGILLSIVALFYFKRKIIFSKKG